MYELGFLTRSLYLRNEFNSTSPGNMIYGLIGSQLLFFLFFGMLVFLFLWPVTSAFMIHILAWFTALMITILSKYLLTRLFRKKYYSAFYRRRPRAANLSALAMECWHLGLGGGVLAGRLVQFLLASIFWIGRIDGKPLASTNMYCCTIILSHKKTILQMKSFST